MKISADVREYAKEQGLDEVQALESGMAAKSEEFLAGGSQLYVDQTNTDSPSPSA